MQKSLALAALLLPFSGYGVTKEEQIKRLNKELAQCNKSLESLGALIEQKRGAMQLDSNMAEVYTKQLIRKEIKHRELINNGAFLSKDAQVKIEQDIRRVNELMVAEVSKSIEQGKAPSVSVRELIINEKELGIDSFDSIKFLLIKVLFAQMALRPLVIEYDGLVQKITKINATLMELNK